MEDGVLHAGQGRPHFFHCPDASFLGGLFGAFQRDGAFQKDSPFHRIEERGVKQTMNLMDGGAGQQTLFLLGGELLLFALNILPTGRFAQGTVQVLQVIGLQLLHLKVADIGEDEILDGGQVGLVGFGSPLMLGALFGQPVHQEFTDRYSGRNQESSACKLVFHLLFAVHRLLFGGKALPFVAAFAVLIEIGVADAVGAAAFGDICHAVPP